MYEIRINSSVYPYNLRQSRLIPQKDRTHLWAIFQKFTIYRYHRHAYVLQSSKLFLHKSVYHVCFVVSFPQSYLAAVFSAISYQCILHKEINITTVMFLHFNIAASSTHLPNCTKNITSRFKYKSNICLA